MSQAPTPQPADARLQALIADIRHFVRHRWHPLEEQIERDDEIPPAVVQELRDKGYFGWSIPQAHGGLGLSTEELVRCAFELSQASVALRARVGTNTGIGSEALVADGTEAQKQRWLPRMARGELTGCLALTEPDAGSEASNIQTTARREGDHYVLNGAKTWISNGGIADFYCVFARTGEAPGARGISAFVVDADTPGFSIGERIELIAPHPLATIRFDNCRIPVSQRLGEPGQGFKLAMMTLDIFRASVAAAALGFARRALDEGLARAKSRRMFGQTLGDLQLTQAALGDMDTAIDASALLTYRAAWMHDVKKTRTTREAAMAKMTATESAQAVIDRALRLFGGQGVQSGQVVEGLYREIRALRIYEGASEVQLLIIARELLKA